jgi:tetratricopeptide (TPR) repeat protein
MENNTFFETYPNIKSDSPTDLYLAGLNNLTKKNFQDALSNFNRTIDLDPSIQEAFLMRGILYLEKEMYREAITDFTKYISLNPKDYEAYNNRGFAYFLLGEYKKAEKDLKSSLEINSKDDFAGLMLDKIKRIE